MALITRVSRLFTADFHAVLDRIEEPGVLLRQAVREMEEELAHDGQQRKLLQHELRALTSRESDLAQSLLAIGEELDTCFESGNDKLARGCIRRRLEAQRLGKIVTRKRAALAETLDELDSRLAENQQRLESMRQKAELLAGENTRPADDWSFPEVTVHDEDVEVAFLREKQNRRQS